MSERGGCKRCKAGTPHTFNHGTSTGYSYHLCRCTECKQWAREASMKGYWANRDRELEEKRRQRERNLDVHLERERAKRNKPETRAAVQRRKEKYSRVPVTRSRKWMPHEKELVLRDDLSILELAYMLERSPSSVQAQRSWLRDADRIRERNKRWREANYDWYIEHRRAIEGVTPRGQRTHCKRGHPYDDENTYWNQGARYCKTCRKKPPAPPRPPITHCPQGHPYDAANTRIVGTSYRVCKQCDRDRHNARYVPKPKQPKTYCPQGHEYDAVNTVINSRGSRVCRICRLDQKRRYNAKLKENAA